MPSTEKLCTDSNCEREVVARGLCRKHYNAWHRTQAKRQKLRTAHLLWFGSSFPADYEEQVGKFQALNPDWTIKLWDEGAVDELNLKNADTFYSAEELVPLDSRFQLMSDVARLEILYRYGGLYIDADFLWQRPVDPLIEQAEDGQLVTVWERQWRYVANGFIFSPPRHPVLKQAIETVPDWVAARRKGARANRITGPAGQWTHLTRPRRSDVHVLHQKHLCPVPWDHPEWVHSKVYPQATGLHTWGHQRELRGMVAR